MIKYYKLFDLLNRRGMKKSDLRTLISPKTIAKLSKGENINTDIIDKICLYLKCQPSDIMEVVDEVVMENTDAYLVTEIEDVEYDEIEDRAYDITTTKIVARDKETGHVEFEDKIGHI